MIHELPIRVYYEDTDAGAFVYYANYLQFAERARTEFLRELGFENKALMDSEGVAFVVRHIEADYLKPAYLDDLLRVETALETVKNASFVMKQTVFRHNDALFSMTVTLACVNLKTQKPAGLPAALRAVFKKHI